MSKSKSREADGSDGSPKTRSRRGNNRRELAEAYSTESSGGARSDRKVLRKFDNYEAGPDPEWTLESDTRFNEAALYVSKEARESRMSNRLYESASRLVGGGSPRIGISRESASFFTIERVFGDDDRTRITNTEDAPWRWICSLIMKTGNGKRFVGTGFFIAPRLIVTAGHVVYTHNENGEGTGWMREVTIIPGRNGEGSAPFGRHTVDVSDPDTGELKSVGGWTGGGSDRSRFDLGAILLPSDAPFNDLGYFGFETLEPADYSDRPILNVAGYPGEHNGMDSNKPVGTLWYHGQAIESIDDYNIFYKIDTTGGESGGPLYWKKPDGKRRVLGIHTNGPSSGNFATRITQPVFDKLMEWRNLAM